MLEALGQNRAHLVNIWIVLGSLEKLDPEEPCHSVLLSLPAVLSRLEPVLTRRKMDRSMRLQFRLPASRGRPRMGGSFHTNTVQSFRKPNIRTGPNTRR